jgi:xanthine/CO dehydrogenase XdhC/CoxF family maturation factor
LTDLEPILTLWRELDVAGSEYVLATVVRVEGSGYRKPGAMMLIAEDGRKKGTISGGCLEGEVAKKAMWYTARGPVVRTYSTSADDGDVPFGMGCGGVVHVLLERSASARGMLGRLAARFEAREPMAVATVLDGEWIGRRGYFDPHAEAFSSDLLEGSLRDAAREAYVSRRSFSRGIVWDGREVLVRAEWRSARPGLFVFGAGDDAVLVVRLARQLGWYVAVVDGRSHLATRERFAEADDVYVLGLGERFGLKMLPTDAAALMSHSLEQDTYFLSEMLRRELAYIGVLGPRRRTRDVLRAIAERVRGDEVELQVEEWMRRVHAPMGLDLGGETPADIALAIVAEIQKGLYRASGVAMREARGGAVERVVLVCGL